MVMVDRRGTGRNIWWLFMGFSAISVLGWYANMFSPDAPSLFVWLYLLIFLTIFFFSLFIFNNVRRAMLTASGIVIFLLLRYFNLREILYPILLVACIVSIELYAQKR
jgi:hypothetical protein